MAPLKISVIRKQFSESDPPAFGSIDLNNPPVVSGSILVGDFHTHALKAGLSKGYGNPNKPSKNDKYTNAQGNVPGLIRSGRGIIPFGPKRRGSDPKHAGPSDVQGGYPGSGSDTRKRCH